MKKKTSEAQIKAVARYNMAHTRQANFRLNTVTDADVIARLDAVPNRRRYIIDLIRADIVAHPDIEIQEDAE